MVNYSSITWPCKSVLSHTILFKTVHTGQWASFSSAAVEEVTLNCGSDKTGVTLWTLFICLLNPPLFPQNRNKLPYPPIYYVKSQPAISSALRVATNDQEIPWVF